MSFIRVVFCVLALATSTPVYADTFLDSGTWESTGPSGVAIQRFTFSGQNYSGFIGSIFGLHPSGGIAIPGTNVGFFGSINSGDFGEITINGHIYEMDQFHCSLNTATVPCGSGTTNIFGQAMTPLIDGSNTVSLTFPVTVSGAFGGFSLDGLTHDLVTFQGAGTATVTLIALGDEWIIGALTATVAAPIPEPSTGLLLVFGLITLVACKAWKCQRTLSGR